MVAEGYEEEGPEADEVLIVLVQPVEVLYAYRRVLSQVDQEGEVEVEN